MCRVILRAGTAGSLGLKRRRHFLNYEALLPPLCTNEIICMFLLIAWNENNFSCRLVGVCVCVYVCRKCPVINELIKIRIPRYQQALILLFIAFSHLESLSSRA